MTRLYVSSCWVDDPMEILGAYWMVCGTTRNVGATVRRTSPDGTNYLESKYIKKGESATFSTGHTVKVTYVSPDKYADITVEPPYLPPIDEPYLPPIDPFEPDCKTLWYHDNESKICQQKEFCGAYAYEGLKTFSTKEECEKSLKGETETLDNVIIILIVIAFAYILTLGG